jgi:hypothetical protein
MICQERDLLCFLGKRERVFSLLLLKQRSKRRETRTDIGCLGAKSGELKKRVRRERERERERERGERKERTNKLEDKETNDPLPHSQFPPSLSLPHLAQSEPFADSLSAQREERLSLSRDVAVSRSPPLSAYRPTRILLDKKYDIWECLRTWSFASASVWRTSNSASFASSSSLAPF